VILAIFRLSGIKPKLNQELNIHDKGLLRGQPSPSCYFTDSICRHTA